MKKIIAIVLALMMVLAMTACGEEPAAPTQPTAAPTTEAPASVSEGGETPTEVVSSGVPACTNENPVVNLYGEFTKDAVQEGVLVTNVGQSADSATMASLLNRAGAAFEQNDMAKAEELEGFGTLVVVCGASTKGLGAAGISQEQELERAKDMLAAAESKGMTIILAHLGGSGRRGSSSDLFIDVVMDAADYMLVVEDGNTDGYFSSYCEAHSIPLTLVKSAKNASDTVNALFG